MKSTFGPILVGVLLLALVVVSPAGADIVTVAVTGEVTASDFATIAKDSVVTGYYRYDDAAPDLDPSDYWAAYHSIALSLSFVDGSTISSNECILQINNNSGGGGTVDEYNLSIPYLPGQYTATGVFTGWVLHTSGRNRLYRYDDTGAALDSDARPDPESVLALLPNDQSGLGFGVEPYSEEWSVLNFELRDLSVVPVPGAFVLGNLGLGSAGWLVRRKRARA